MTIIFALFLFLIQPLQSMIQDTSDMLSITNPVIEQTLEILTTDIPSEYRPYIPRNLGRNDAPDCNRRSFNELFSAIAYRHYEKSNLILGERIRTIAKDLVKKEYSETPDPAKKNKPAIFIHFRKIRQCLQQLKEVIVEHELQEDSKTLSKELNHELVKAFECAQGFYISWTNDESTKHRIIHDLNESNHLRRKFKNLAGVLALMTKYPVEALYNDFSETHERNIKELAHKLTILQSASTAERFITPVACLAYGLFTTIQMLPTICCGSESGNKHCREYYDFTNYIRALNAIVYNGSRCVLVPLLFLRMGLTSVNLPAHEKNIQSLEKVVAGTLVSNIIAILLMPTILKMNGYDSISLYYKDYFAEDSFGYLKLDLNDGRFNTYYQTAFFNTGASLLLLGLPHALRYCNQAINTIQNSLDTEKPAFSFTQCLKDFSNGVKSAPAKLLKGKIVND